MKFAVIEYSSKSGAVWKHTDEHPNYLADPQKEIDPTSFGCYVSALKGEHVPLTGLIVGPVEQVSNYAIVYRKVFKRLSGSWPKAYSIEYLKKFDTILMVHQLSDAHEMVSLTRRLKKAKPETFIAGVPTQPYRILRESVEKDQKAKHDLVDFINACDVFVVVVKNTVRWYKSMSKVPVVYVPQPYPTSFASQNFLPRQKKGKSILVAGVTQRNNIKQGQTVARELQKKFPEYLIYVPKVHDMDYDETNLKDARYELFPFEQWRDHLKTLAKTMLVINTDYTLTRGRVQTDCAAVGTPSIGGNSDGQRDLFPELVSSKDTSVAELVTLGTKLLTDDGYYNSVATYASEQLKKYDYEESATRMHMLVRTCEKTSEKRT